MGRHTFFYYSLSSLGLLMNGQPVGHGRRLKMDYEHGHYACVYTNIMSSLGSIFIECGISYGDFARGYSLWF